MWPTVPLVSSSILYFLSKNKQNRVTSLCDIKPDPLVSHFASRSLNDAVDLQSSSSLQFRLTLFLLEAFPASPFSTISFKTGSYSSSATVRPPVHHNSKLPTRIPMHTHAFVHPVLLRASSWTPTPIRTSPIRSSHVLVPKPQPVMSLYPATTRLRRAFIATNSSTSSPSSVSTSLVHVPATRLSTTTLLTRPARTVLAFAARTARRVSTLRRRHAFSLRLARMATTLALAAVSYFVTRGAMSGLATVSAPALPSMPTLRLPFTLPDRLAAVMKPFTESFGVVFLSEFGDKSMFATALMAMKHNPFIVCIGAFAALTVMTFIACFLGQLMQLLPATVTHYSSIALFVFFGLQMILQSRHLPNTPGGVGGERADAEELVAGATVTKVQSPLTVLAKVASLIFVAEWCDRSMLATMALASGGNTVAVIGGATFANIVCTGVAVSAATVVASKISERMVALVGGILFEFFAVFTYFEGPEG